MYHPTGSPFVEGGEFLSNEKSEERCFKQRIKFGVPSEGYAAVACLLT